jgi:hypothetical protein
MRAQTPSPFIANVTSLKPPRSDGSVPRTSTVHLVEVPGEQVGLLAALGAADLDDDVAVVVGIAGQQQDAELVGEPGDRSLRGVDLGPEDVALVSHGVRKHALGHLEVGPAGAQLARALDDRGQLPVAPGHLLEAGLVGDEVGVAQARLGVTELPVQLGEALEHDQRGYPALWL